MKLCNRCHGEGHEQSRCPRTDPCFFCLIWDGKAVLNLTVHADDKAVAGPREKIHKILSVLNGKFTTTSDIFTPP